MIKILVQQCLLWVVECLAWAEWECNPKTHTKSFKNAREINLSGVFFCKKFQRRLQRRFNEGLN
jgi:hypothetical protein